MPAAVTVMLRGVPDVVAAFVGGGVPVESDIVTVHVPAASPEMPAVLPPVAAELPSPNMIVPPPLHTLFGDTFTPTL